MEYNPYTHQNQHRSTRPAEGSRNASGPYQPDDGYYDPPGIVRGTPDPNDFSARSTPAPNNIIHFPDHAQFMEDAPPLNNTLREEEPESFLLQNLTRGSQSNNYGYQDRTFDYPDPDPEDNRAPSFQVDNRIHNYYNTDGALPENTVPQRNHGFLSGFWGGHTSRMEPEEDERNDAIIQEGDPYNFMPFPVANGENYQINPFMNDMEEEETLLDSSPHRSDETQGHSESLETINDIPPMHTNAYPENLNIPDPNFDPLQYPGEPQLQPQQVLGPVAPYQQQQPAIQPYDAPGFDMNNSFQQVQQPIPHNAPPNITVQLFHGHLVLDCPVPNKIKKIYAEFLEKNPQHRTQSEKETPREFDFMRYSAVTCDPEDFSVQFGLRQQFYARPRSTEIFICVTLYNESEDLLAKTLQGIAKNLVFFSKKKAKDWGTNAWKKIVVCVVADGREKLNKRTRVLMERLGVFQNGLAKNIVGSKPVKAHVYEYSSLVGVNNVKKTVSFGALKAPMQLIFCLKEHNKGKINSHRWYFQAFSKALQPKLCVLIDAGTVPGDDSIYHLWNTFDQESNVGGACGEIRASLGRGWSKLYNPLVAAQNFEYKMSNILDKPLESVCGFITVLPGAFSAYRYKALINMDGYDKLRRKNCFTEEGPHQNPFQMDSVMKNEANVQQAEELGPPTEGETEAAAAATAAEAREALRLQSDPVSDDLLLNGSPLGQYFKGETMKLQGKSAGIFTANMYLAEDRILCFELVTKKGENWLLKYVKSAHATTDVPEKLSELVLQRRRWLNGSFFAAIYSIAHVYHLGRSSHNIIRKLVLLIEFAYQTISILFSWFGIGNFFLVFRILTRSLGDDTLGFAPGNVLSWVFLYTYCACIISIFVLSFGNRPKGTPFFYTIVVCFFAILMAYLLFASVFISVKSIIYTLCSTHGHITASFVFHNSLFRDLVVSLMSTYALYVVSSFLFLEPWHIFTSSLQYLLITPSYINVLNVYAFCNLHDISWGTKGDDKLKDDLGQARIKNDYEVEAFLPNHRSLIDKAYQIAIDELKRQAPVIEEIPSEEDRTKDWYAMFRSMVVLFWIFTNLALVVVVLTAAGQSAFKPDPSSSTPVSTTKAFVEGLLTRKDMIPNLLSNAGPTASEAAMTVTDYINKVTLAARQAATDTDVDSCGAIGSQASIRTEIYLTVILWSVAGLAAFRFLGSLIYIVLRLLGPY